MKPCFVNRENQRIRIMLILMTHDMYKNMRFNYSSNLGHIGRHLSYSLLI